MPKVSTEADEKFELYAEYLADNYELEIDALDLQNAVRLYPTFQTSDENRKFNAERGEKRGQYDRKAGKKSAKAESNGDADEADDDEAEETPAPRKRRGRPAGKKATTGKRPARRTRKAAAEADEDEPAF